MWPRSGFARNRLGGARGSHTLEPAGEIKPPPKWLGLAGWPANAAAEHVPGVKLKQNANGLLCPHRRSISLPAHVRTGSHYQSFAAPLSEQPRNRKNRLQAVLRAGATGLEPATSGVTGRRSNQLSYAPLGMPSMPRTDFFGLPQLESRSRVSGGVSNFCDEAPNPAMGAIERRRLGEDPNWGPRPV